MGHPDLHDPATGAPSLAASTDAAIAEPLADEPPLAAELKPATTPAVDHDAAIARAEATLARLSAPPAPPPAVSAPVDLGPKPNRYDYDSPESYDAALVGWAARDAAHRTLAERTKQDHERAVGEHQAAAHQAAGDLYGARRSKFAASHPDYAEVAESDALPISPPMAMAITNSPAGPQIAYYLGKHPDEAARIAAIQTPAMVLYEIGRLAARAETGELAKLSRAASPPARRAAPTPRSGAPRELPMNEYAKVRNEQLAKERRGGRMFG
jgi:hypothetical protein